MSNFNKFKNNYDTDDLKETEGVKGGLYRGVIEDDNDPLRIDRVRVRVFGMHTHDKAQLPTSGLPWAEVFGDLSFGLTSGVGTSRVPVNGTHVWVMFENQDPQKPVVIGSIPGIKTQKDPSQGFFDPNGTYPKYEGEPDTNRLHRNENYAQSALSSRDAKLEPLVFNTLEGSAIFPDWTQPSGLNTNSQYPWNHVTESKSGHVLEIDDTPGNERLHFFHKSGSFKEFRPSGDVSNNTEGDDFEVIKKDSHRLVKMNEKESTYLNKHTYVQGNLFKLVMGIGNITYTSGLSVKAGTFMKLTAPIIMLN